MKRPNTCLKVFSFVLLLMLVLPSLGLAQVSFPDPKGFVNDFANVMDQRSEAEVHVIADKLQKEQGVELAVVTIQTTSPLTPKQYTTELFEKWGIGGPEDSGLLVLVAIEERRIEVEPGYGLEGVLPDGKIGAILDEIVTPYLKQDQYGQGLANGAKAFQATLAGEEYAKDDSEDESNDWLLAFIIFIAIAILMSRQAKNYPPGGGGSGRIGRPRMGGFFGPGPRFPGGSGGGFGGFGGGRSGGGGAGRGF